MAKLVDEGENLIANIVLGSTAKVSTLYLGLYMDTSEPAETDTLADLTEPSGNGYARISLAAASWTIVDDLASYAQQTFTATGAWGYCYGYFIGTSSDNSGKLLWVTDFTYGPYNVQNNGDTIKVTPKVRFA